MEMDHLGCAISDGFANISVMTIDYDDVIYILPGLHELSGLPAKYKQFYMVLRVRFVS